MKYEERVVKPPLPDTAQACCAHASSCWAQPGKQRHSLKKRRTKGKLSQPTTKPCPCLPTPHQNSEIPWWVPQHIDVHSTLCHMPIIPILPRPTRIHRTEFHRDYKDQRALPVAGCHLKLQPVLFHSHFSFLVPRIVASTDRPRIVVFVPWDLLTGMPSAVSRVFQSICWHISLEWKERQHNPAKRV